MTTIWPVRPWRSAFKEERCLPSAVLGPVDSSALARLILILFGIDMPWYTSGGSGVGVGGSWKVLKRRELGVVGWGVIRLNVDAPCGRGSVAWWNCRTSTR